MKRWMPAPWPQENGEELNNGEQFEPLAFFEIQYDASNLPLLLKSRLNRNQLTRDTGIDKLLWKVDVDALGVSSWDHAYTSSALPRSHCSLIGKVDYLWEAYVRADPRSKR